jgi:C1A family cysteine protease
MSSQDSQSIDPNAHADRLARLMHQLTQDAQNQASALRAGSIEGGEDVDNSTNNDPNYLAQKLASNGDPSTMPKTLKAAKPTAVESSTPSESPNETADKLSKTMMALQSPDASTSSTTPDASSSTTPASTSSTPDAPTPATSPETTPVASTPSSSTDSPTLDSDFTTENVTDGEGTTQTTQSDSTPSTDNNQPASESTSTPPTPAAEQTAPQTTQATPPAPSTPDVKSAQPPAATVSTPETPAATAEPAKADAAAERDQTDLGDGDTTGDALTQGADDGSADATPPAGTGGNVTDSWQNPTTPDHWDQKDDAAYGPDAASPSAAYDPDNVQGDDMSQGEDYATEPAADSGNVYTAKKPESAEKEDEKAEEKKSNAKIVIKGAKFGTDSPTKQDVRTHDVIVARHIDEERDAKVGVALSNYNLNYVFSEPDERDHKFSDIFGAPDPNYLPATSDLRPTWGPILDQLDLGSCVSNSVSYCIRFCFKKQKLGDFTPSRLFIYYNGRMISGYPINEDSGLTIRDGYKSVGQYSVCSENNWPYVPAKFAQRPPDTCYVSAQQHKTFRYINLDNSEVQIKKCLKDGYPISFGAALYESFMGAKVAQTGIVPMPEKNEQRAGGHAMTIVGHDDAKKAFLVCNNWGDSWGLKGFCWIPYDYITNTDLVGDLWSPRWFS